MNLWLPDKEGLGLLALGYIFSGCAGESRPGQCLFPPGAGYGACSGREMMALLQTPRGKVGKPDWEWEQKGVLLHSPLVCLSGFILGELLRAP